MDGRFVELPSGREVAPTDWLREPATGIVAGFLAYELAWDLLDIRAPRTRGEIPRMWAARFSGSEPADDDPVSDGELHGLRSRVSAAEYQSAVARCIDDITRGELFEVNYTARFDAFWSGTAGGFYDALRTRSTGDHFGFLATEDFAIASVSPESFVSVDEGVVLSRPIKGTRARSDDEVADRAARAELLASAKDRAENIMIVDLMRNDLTRVCELGSVVVTGLCELESFAGVHHLVSTVEGRLRRGRLPIDVLLECFPAGSITGAPKLRAIEIAAEVEVGARGAYTGTMFVATADTLRSSVLIRTATLLGEPGHYRVEYGAGGAVVADSDPRDEWREALTKVTPLTRIAAEQPSFE